MATPNVREGIICGFCNPLLDISATVPLDYLAKYDLKEDDAILAEDKHLPIYEELIKDYNAEFIPGGAGQNTMRVCNWMLKKPCSTVYFGCVGEDKYSEILRENAKKEKFNVQYQVTKDAPTGTCAVLINGTHRTLVANLGAANKFSIDHIKKQESRDYIEGADYFYISGFFLTVSPPTIMEVVKFAACNNRPVIMNLSAPFISELFKEPLMEVLPYVDILIGNIDEAHAFAKAQCWDEVELADIGKKIIDLPKVNKERQRVVIFTQHENPVILIQKRQVCVFPVRELRDEEIVDTNGAGDAFAGGFLSQLVQCKPFDICVKAGLYCAAKIIGTNGCTLKSEPDFQP